jgi:hypothetical protein
MDKQVDMSGKSCLVVKWYLSCEFWLNLRSQSEQAYGFSPVWILMCLPKQEDCVDL